jgi:AraC-like DNA-binding protein
MILYRPGPPLDSLVDCFWLCERYVAPSAQERVLPSGTLDLVVNLEADRLRIHAAGDEDGPALALPGAALCGAHAAPFVIAASPTTSTLGVHFKPGGAFPFLDVPAGDLESRHVPLETLWGAGARALRDRLLEVTEPATRFKLLEQFLLGRARRPLHRGLLLTTALDALEGPARLSVSEVNRRTGMSPKRLIALFRDQVGLTPKAFARVRRFQGALRGLARADTRGAALAAHLGYFDQAHLDREFRALAGVSPREWRAARSERPNHLPLRG